MTGRFPVSVPWYIVTLLITGLLLIPAGPARAGAPFGNALKLDGVDDYANIPDNSTLDLGATEGEDFTVESFFYVPNETNETVDVIFWKQYAYALSVAFHTASADSISFKFWSCAAAFCENTLSNTTTLTTGWHHIAAVYDNEFTATNDRAAIYLDGAELASNSSFELTPGVNNSANLLSVGANSGAVALVGWLDEARFSDIVRYSGDYSVPSSAFTTDGNTRALWHFDDAPCATSFIDSSGNGNTLAGQNGAQTGPPGAASPTVQFSSSTYSRGEGRRAQITVTRTGDPLPTVRVRFATSDGTATAGVDYGSVTRRISMSCGEMSKGTRVPTIQDALVEGDETVNLMLSRPAGASLGSPSTATLTILDDD